MLDKTLLGTIIVLLLLYAWHMLASVDFVSYREFASLVAKNPYFKQLSKEDLIYRNVPNAQVYLRKYLSHYRSVCPSQKLKLRVACQKATDLLPLKLRLKWRVVKLHANHEVENGYAHTLDDVIILVDYCMEYPMQKLVATLIHEAVHIYQRYNPFDNNILLQRLGFFPEYPAGQNYPLQNIAPYAQLYLGPFNNTSMGHKPMGDLWSPNHRNVSTDNSVANPDHDKNKYYVVINDQKNYLQTQYKGTGYGGDVNNVMIDPYGKQKEIDSNGILYAGQPNEYSAELIARVITNNPQVDHTDKNIILSWMAT